MAEFQQESGAGILFPLGASFATSLAEYVNLPRPRGGLLKGMFLLLTVGLLLSSFQVRAEHGDGLFVSVNDPRLGTANGSGLVYRSSKMGRHYLITAGHGVVSADAVISVVLGPNRAARVSWKRLLFRSEPDQGDLAVFDLGANHLGLAKVFSAVNENAAAEPRAENIEHRYINVGFSGSPAKAFTRVCQPSEAMKTFDSGVTLFHFSCEADDTVDYRGSSGSPIFDITTDKLIGTVVGGKSSDSAQVLVMAFDPDKVVDQQCGGEDVKLSTASAGASL